jgi:hypothetical protein
MRGDKLILAPDPRENPAKADKFEAGFAKSVDEFIAKNGIEAPKRVRRIPRRGDTRT